MITDDPQSEFDELFLRHGLPPPRLALRAESMLTWLIGLESTDMLSISPARYIDSPLLNKPLIQIPVRERLSGPTISLIQRASFPLTPAAEYLADLLRRSASPLRAA